jgi:hypothetical protein
MEVAMPQSDGFAFKNSGLNDFLFAEVGAELNGSPLTILSVLARLGQDPWAEAGRWAGLPRAAAIDCLACSISQMPLSPEALLAAHATAARLVGLLPSPGQRPERGREPAVQKTEAMPDWVPIVLIAGLVFAAGLSLSRWTPSVDTAAALSEHRLSKADQGKP